MTQAPVSPPPQMLLMQMITGYWVSQCIFVAARLGIADLLKSGPKAVVELATATHSQPEALARVLRALASVGIFAETGPGVFALTSLASFLETDNPNSVRAAAVMMGDAEHYASWGNILHAVKTGESSFQNLYGMDVFAYYAQNPEAATVFDQAMTSFSSLEIAGVMAEYDFSRFSSIVDVAGGQGRLLTTILQANPEVQGILFDVPEVIARAQSQIADSPVHSRCQVVSGSFFESLPPGAEAYVFKHILHDWNDAASSQILQNCHQAMGPTGTLLIIETVIPPGNEPFMGKFLDVNMLVMCPGGKERTAAEFQTLLEQSGFQLRRIIPTPGLVSIIEATPV